MVFKSRPSAPSAERDLGSRQSRASGTDARPGLLFATQKLRFLWFVSFGEAMNLPRAARAPKSTRRSRIKQNRQNQSGGLFIAVNVGLRKLSPTYGTGRARGSFSLVRFFWRSKRNEPAARSPRPKTFAAQPHKTKPPESIWRFIISQRRARLAEGVTRKSDFDITHRHQRRSRPAP